MSPLRVSVVVVTWNGLDLTLRCVESLLAQRTQGLDVQVLVVDNGSQDGTAEALAHRPDLRLVALPRNLGFAGGVNAGVRASDGDVVVLINNDAVAAPDFVARIVAPFADAPAAGPGRLGATTGRVRLSGRFVPAPDDRSDALVAHDGRRWVRTPDGGPEGVELLNSTGNDVTRSGNGRDRDWLAPADRPAGATEVFGFNGGCAALSRAALDDVGPFDESLFMYYEDTEMSWRLRRRGWGVVHVPDAVTVHDHAASSGTSSAFFLDHNERNRLLVALVHAPWSVVLRGTARAVVRTAVGPDRRRRARALVAVVRRLPWALRRRHAVDRAATVHRAVPAALLVADGSGR